MTKKKWQLSEKKKPLVAALLALGFKEQELDPQHYNYKVFYYSWIRADYTNTISMAVDNKTNPIKILESILTQAHGIGQAQTKDELQHAVTSIRSFLRL